MSKRLINLLYLCNMRNIMFIGPRSSQRLFQIYQFHAKVKEATQNIRVSLFVDQHKQTSAYQNLKVKKHYKSLLALCLIFQHFSRKLRKIR